MTDPTLSQQIQAGTAHATSDDIRAIIEARRASQAARIEAARVAASQAMHAELYPGAPSGATTAHLPVSNLRMQDEQPGDSLDVPAEPQPTPAPSPVTDEDLTGFLNSHYPALKQAAIDLVQPPFRWSEILTLGERVSEAVHDGLPLLKGQDAGNFVDVITGFLFDTYIAPKLPAPVKLVSGLLRMLLIQSIEFAYRAVVKPKG